MDLLTIERIGGLAGLSGQGSRIKSRGQLALASLCVEDQTAIEHLFVSHTKKRAVAVPDGFCYRVSRALRTGVETVEVPEDAMPRFLIRCIKDELT